MFLPGNRMRWFSIAVICYMIIGICWWSFLLFNENIQKHNLKLELSQYQFADLSEVENEYKRRSFMILGEGLVLIISLTAGVWIINRSAIKEIKTATSHSNFLLSVSHELKSPIATLKLALETLKRPRLSELDADEIKDSAIQEAVRLESLVENILVSAHLDHQDLQLVKEFHDIDLIVQSLKKKLHRYQSRMLIQIDENLTSHKVFVDKQNFERCLENLILNAGQYSSDESNIELSIGQNREKHLFKIADKGPGISMDDQKRIFDKFYRGSEARVRAKKGTGLGLYISYQIAKAHGGDLKYNNRAEGGSIFTLEIPVISKG